MSSLMKPSIDIVVISRHLDAMLRECLLAAERSALRASDLSWTHHVVDNASSPPTPGHLEGAPRYRLYRFDRHRGFATACNHAAQTGQAEFLLFLNNDVLLHPDVITTMVQAAVDHPRRALWGARLVFPDGTIQHAGVVFGPGDVGPYHAGRRKPSPCVPRGKTRFQAVTGACMMVRRDVFDRVGGFDECYPFGLEDIDLCLRVRQAGYGVQCLQETESLHFESMTPGREELDAPSRALFMERWKGRYTIDG